MAIDRMDKEPNYLWVCEKCIDGYDYEILTIGRIGFDHTCEWCGQDNGETHAISLNDLIKIKGEWPLRPPVENLLKMESTIMTVTGIKKPTRAKFFKDFKVGTQFSLNMGIKKPGQNGSSLHASYIKVTNHDTDKTYRQSISNLLNRLKMFNFKEVVVDSDLISKAIENAHMAGQGKAGVDPSYSSAMSYAASVLGKKNWDTSGDSPCGD